MLHSPRKVLLRAAWAIALCGASLAQTTEGNRADLDAVAASARSGEWSKADALLKVFLERHKMTAEARHARAEIVDLHRRISFEVIYRAPAFSDLVSGKVYSYNPRTGHIKLGYTPKTLQDFADPNKPAPKKPERKRRRGRARRFESPRSPAGAAPVFRPRIHPAVFESCKMTLEGERYSGTQFLAGIRDAQSFRITAGVPPHSQGFSQVYLPTSIVQMLGKVRQELFSEDWQKDPRTRASKKKRKNGEKPNRWPFAYGKPYRFELEFAPRRARLKFSRKEIAKARWSEKAVGKIGFADNGFRRLTITGRVEPSWLQGLADEHRHAAVEAFERTYQAQKVLPAWLFAKLDKKPVGGSRAKTAPGRYYPGSEAPRDLKFVQDCVRALRENKSTSVLLRLGLSKPDRVPKLVAAYLTSWAEINNDRYAKAIDLAERVVKGDPSFYLGRSLLGRAYLGLGRNRAAETQFRAVLSAQPDSVAPYYYLALALVRQAKIEAAKRLLGEASVRRLSHPLLEEMRVLCERLLHGPRFARRFVVKTKHYSITSDIDEKVCREAGKVLEGAFAFYCSALGNVRDKIAEGERFKVNLFSGEAGYKRYLKGLKLKMPIHTAGIYSSELKQLLIWNLPSRTEMLRTIRHEGFHQFFDLLVKDAPIWLNEGHAEYFELSRTNTGKPVPGRMQERHRLTLALIRPSSRGSLEAFLHLSRSEFYSRKAIRNYALSMALVRYLRQGPAKVREAYRRLIRALAAGKSREEALALAFDRMDMKKFERGFWASVERLQKVK